MAVPLGPLEEWVRNHTSFASDPGYVENASSAEIHNAHQDAAEAREALNSHMGRLQRLLLDREEREREIEGRRRDAEAQANQEASEAGLQ